MVENAQTHGWGRGSGWAVHSPDRFDTRRSIAIVPRSLFMNRNPHVAVVGATGAVGIEMIKTLEKRNFPVGKLTLLASARSVDRKLRFSGEEFAVKELTKESFGEID